MNRDNKGVVLLVDSDRFVLDAASMLLGIHGYRVIMCEEREEAEAVLRDKGVDVVLCDVRMVRSGADGLIDRALESSSCPPVLLMSGYADVDSAVETVQKGGFDLIVKPYRPEHLLVKIERAVEYSNLRRMEKMYRATFEETVKRAAEDIERANLESKEAFMEVIDRLASAAEFREGPHGRHARRVGQYAGLIAGRMGLGAGFVEEITFAAPMHDIGMIGIPGPLLSKGGPLTPAEFETVKTHTMEGHRLLDGSSHNRIKMAASVALTHHERWDGSGYPCGLKGDEIPLEGMITMICDRYDALRSRRPYRPALGHNESMSIITGGNGRSQPGHFHPLALEAFCKAAPELEEIFAANHESDAVAGPADLLQIG